ncbi:MAG: hypothetical protein ACREVO_02960 [Steroidobacteraceae bacterium]
MRRSSYLGLLALLAVVLPGVVCAQDAATTDDVRCVIVGMLMAQSGANAAERQAGPILALYYIGRLDGRSPSFDLEGAIVKEVTKMTQADYLATAHRCGRTLQTRGNEITVISKDLIKRGQGMQQSSGAPKP